MTSSHSAGPRQCHGKASDTGESNWSTGGKFSLAVVISIIVYISFGITYTTSRRLGRGESTAEIRAASWWDALPHRTHWASLAMYVRAGVAFTFGLKDDRSYESV